MVTKTGPNNASCVVWALVGDDASHVVWALGKFFFVCMCVSFLC